MRRNRNSSGSKVHKLRYWLIFFLVSTQNRLLIKIVTQGFCNASMANTLTRVGSEYGGWWVPTHLLNAKETSRVAISIGIGHDVTFDESILRNGFKLIALDPLRECVTYAEKMLQNFSGVIIENFGLSNFTGSELFFAPKNVSHDSWSSVNLQSTSMEESIVFDVISISDLLVRYQSELKGAKTVLKMDIEGAEIKVIPALCLEQFQFDFIGIEMDFLSLIPFLHLKKRLSQGMQARKLMQLMDKRGYKFVKSENFNFFWYFNAE